MNIWDLSFGLRWNKAQIKKETDDLKNSFKKVWDDIEKELGKNTLWWMEKKVKLLREELNKTEIGTKRFKDLQKELVNTEKQLDKLITSAGKTESAFGWLWKAFVWFFAIDKIKDWILWIVNLAREAEKIQVRFTNFTGSVKEANDIIGMLRETSIKTPFELTELTDAWMKLMAIAWITKNDLIPTITDLWDIASSQWKGINQVVEAYNDAIVWEFERLKEFWIRAEVVWDKVTFTFKWQQTQVEKTQEAISNYIRSLSDVEWVQGSMETQSKTLDGQLSNLSASWNNLWTTIWLSVLPYLKDFVDILNVIIWWLLWTGKVILSLWKILVGSFVTSLVIVWEVIWKSLWYLSENFGKLWKNIWTFAKYVIDNFSIIAWNIPAIFWAWLDSITEKLSIWWNKAINFINSISEKIWAPIIKPIDFRTNLWWWMKELKWMWNMENLTPFWDLSLTSKSFGMLTDEIDKLWSSFEKVESIWTWAIEKTTTKIKEQAITLNLLNKKLNDLKDKLWWVAVGSDEFLKIQAEIKKTQEEIEKAEWKKSWWSGKSEKVKQAEKESKFYEELNKKNKEEDDKLFDQKMEREKKEVEEFQKNQKKKYDTLKDGYEKWKDFLNKQIEDSKKQVKSFDDDIKKLQETINWIQKEIDDLEWSKGMTLWERNIEIVKRELAIQEELNKSKREWINISLAESLWMETLKNMQNWWISEIWWWKIEDLIKVIELQKELNNLSKEKQLITSNASETELAEAKRINELNPTAKFLEDFEKEKLILEGKKKVEEQKLIDLETQKKAEQTIIETFTKAKEELDARYAKNASDIEATITDNLISETNNRDWVLEAFKNRQLQRIQDIKDAQKSIDVQGENTDLSLKPASLPWFSNGWYTWDGQLNEVAWIVHKWEYVIDNATIKRLPGIIWDIEASKRWVSNINNSKSVTMPGVVVNNQVDLELLLDKIKFRM